MADWTGHVFYRHGVTPEMDKGMNRSESGQLGFSVLLFQDIAVIPVLA